VLDDLLEAWRTNHRITLYLIDQIADEGMSSTLSKHGGRDVAGQFAHMHNVRVWHLQNRAKDLADGLTTFEAKVSPGKDELKEALAASSGAVESFLAGVLSGEPKRRGFKKGIFTTLGYLIAHESHHRGSILLTLKTSGCSLDKKAAYAIWGWDRM
jgi:uncharacterized damage-inducible protein DinB